MLRKQIFVVVLGAGLAVAGCASDSSSSGGANDDFSTVDTSNPNDMPVSANTDSSIGTYGSNVDTSNTATKDYTVVSGDSLWKIARDNNTSIAVIKALNSLDSNTLQVGQTLKIPAN